MDPEGNGMSEEFGIHVLLIYFSKGFKLAIPEITTMSFLPDDYLLLPRHQQESQQVNVNVHPRVTSYKTKALLSKLFKQLLWNLFFMLNPLIESLLSLLIVSCRNLWMFC